MIDANFNIFENISIDSYDTMNEIEQNVEEEFEPVTHFECSDLVTTNFAPVQLSCENILEIYTNCFKSQVKIRIEVENNEIIFSFSQDSSDLQCTRVDFQKLKYLNISSNQLRNTHQIIEMLGSSIEILDISSNFLGKLNAKTFENLMNLQLLNLSNTNLTSFGFSTFYHLNKLKMLDISFNRIKNIDFLLLLLNFKDLETLNLEGNELTAIDSVN